MIISQVIYPIQTQAFEKQIQQIFLESYQVYFHQKQFLCNQYAGIIYYLSNQLMIIKLNTNKSVLFSVVIFLCAFGICHSAIASKIKPDGNIQNVSNNTWMYNYSNFMLLLPLSRELETSYRDTTYKQIFLDILKLYPRNYQTLFVLTVNGYGLEQNIVAAVPHKQDDIQPKYISIKPHSSEFRWTRKNLYLNEIENEFNLYNLQISNENSITKHQIVSKFYQHQLLEEDQLGLQTTFNYFIRYYLQKKINNPQRIKNIAYFAQVDSPRTFITYVKGIQETASINNLRIQATIFISEAWPNSPLNFRLQIDKGLKLGAHRVIVKQNAQNQIKYALIQDKAMAQGIFDLQIGDLFILSIQKP